MLTYAQRRQPRYWSDGDSSDCVGSVETPPFGCVRAFFQSIQPTCSVSLLAPKCPLLAQLASTRLSHSCRPRRAPGRISPGPPNCLPASTASCPSTDLQSLLSGCLLCHPVTICAPPGCYSLPTAYRLLPSIHPSICHCA